MFTVRPFVGAADCFPRDHWILPGAVAGAGAVADLFPRDHWISPGVYAAGAGVAGVCVAGAVLVLVMIEVFAGVGTEVSGHASGILSALSDLFEIFAFCLPGVARRSDFGVLCVVASAEEADNAAAKMCIASMQVVANVHRRVRLITASLAVSGSGPLRMAHLSTQYAQLIPRDLSFTVDASLFPGLVLDAGGNLAYATRHLDWQ